MRRCSLTLPVQTPGADHMPKNLRSGWAGFEGEDQ
jgi:hypothetical protein